MTNPILSLDSVCKNFGPIKVLHNIGIALRPGEVHALIGENGAGKSTTMKILSGYQKQSSGTLRLRSKETTFSSLHDGENAGIVMIHQEFNLAEQLTVEQNIFLGRELKRGAMLDEARMRALSRKYLDRVKCSVDPRAAVSSLSNSEKQMVEIAKALSKDARILIMDEPTAVLTNRETAVLFEQVKQLREQGTAILFTSHKLDEVKELADAVTIMRDGHVVHSGPAIELDENDMATAMVGRDISNLYPEKPALDDGAETVLSVTNLSVPGYVETASFSLKQGEILGVGGLIGAGRTELMEGLAGLRPSSAEKISLFGEEVEINSPGDALKHGLCYLTEDRKLRGLLLNWGMQQNLTLQTLHKFGRVLIDQKAEEKALAGAIGEFDIRAGSLDTKVGNLSGGNQQKLLLAKVMQSEPRILIIDEPTRGIDIGTKQQIYVFLRELAAKGFSIIVISSEMPELIGLADRALVMRLGKIKGELSSHQITEGAMVRLSMGLSAEKTTQTDSNTTTRLVQ